MNKKKNKFYIYKRTNLINGKIYIGQTTQSPEKRWNCEDHSNQAIGKAIQQYGKENFKNEIIDYATTKEELNKKERYWIKYYNSKENGYNKTIGGSANVPRSFGKRFIYLPDELIFNFKKDLIKYLGPAKSSYLERPYYLNFDNTESPIWGVMPIEKFYELQKQGKISVSLDNFSVYSSSGQ